MYIQKLIVEVGFQGILIFPMCINTQIYLYAVGLFIYLFIYLSQRQAILQNVTQRKKIINIKQYNKDMLQYATR
jgi:hypothetical protein